MSTDVRALLKAKTKERAKRIEHPYAAYNAGGQLRCTLCTTIIKHESAWDAHLQTKGHRTKVAHIQELEQQEEEKKRLSKGKRKAEPDDLDEGDAEEMQLDTQQDVQVSKRQRTAEPTTTATSTFPNDFFSDKGRTFPITNNESDEGDDNETNDLTLSSNPPPAGSNTTQLDLEWEQFERDLLTIPKIEVRKQPHHGEVFDRATVMAEPQLIDHEPDGFPAHLALGVPATGVNGELVGGPPNTEENENDIRVRKDIEEKELIMDRIVEEERAQEDADARVNMLKARLALVKKRREEAKAAKLGKSS